MQAYVAGRCDAYTTDVSGLAATRSAQPKPADHIILPDVISQGAARPAGAPRRPALRGPGALDPLRPARAPRSSASPRPTSSQAGRTTRGRRCSACSAAAAISARCSASTTPGWSTCISGVGNYGEIFARNLTPIGIQRGPNALWTAGRAAIRAALPLNAAGGPGAPAAGRRPLLRPTLVARRAGRPRTREGRSHVRRPPPTRASLARRRRRAAAAAVLGGRAGARHRLAGAGRRRRAAVIWWLWSNTVHNLEVRRIATGFGFLTREAGLPIGE